VLLDDDDGPLFPLNPEAALKGREDEGEGWCGCKSILEQRFGTVMTRDNVPSHFTPSFTAETCCTFHRPEKGQRNVERRPSDKSVRSRRVYLCIHANNGGR
jgi:hypothetical protein